MLDENIIRAGKALRIWNGGLMRRRYQTGHVFERGKRIKFWVGRWVEPVMEQGKVRRVLRSKVIGMTSQITKSQARKILADWLKPLNEGMFVPVEMSSFADFYEKWERDMLPTYRESTRRFYRDTARRWIKPYFEDWKMSEIRPEEVQRFVNLFAEKYSKSVIGHVKAALRSLFGAALTWRYVSHDPTAGMRLPRGKGVSRARVLTPEEMGALIGKLAEPWRSMVMLASTTGLRESELFGLKWEDFDLEAGVLRVCRRMYRRRVGETKTEESRREIPLHGELVEAVRGLARAESEFCFVGAKGGFLRPDKVLAEFIRPVADGLGLPRFAWRSFRRSAESVMHNSGVPIKVQQAILGHANPRTTLLYAEADHASKRAAADGLGKIIFPKLSHVATHVASGAYN